MYSYKEKSKHLRDLADVSSAKYDLELLRVLDYQNSLCSSHMACERNAEAILYRLLDITDRDTIRLNRRKLAGLENDSAGDSDSVGGDKQQSTSGSDDLPGDNSQNVGSAGKSEGSNNDSEDADSGSSDLDFENETTSEVISQAQDVDQPEDKPSTKKKGSPKKTNIDK